MGRAMRSKSLVVIMSLAGSLVLGAHGTQQRGVPGGPARTSGNETTRGIGVYPGQPDEDFSPSFRLDATTYRNLARLRPAYHSSAYDYNLTAQLVTDGIVETSMPRWVTVASWQQGLTTGEAAALADASLNGHAR